VEMDIQSITPAVTNDPQVSTLVQQTVRELMEGSDLDTGMMTMGSEDMAFMMQDIPGCYFFVGSANSEKGLDAPHHHPRFDVDEESLPRAAALMAAATVKLLDSQGEHAVK
jgi:amidohydrolase